MKDTQAAVERVAGLAASQVARLAQANQAQEDTWKQIDESMRQYQQVFSQVEKNASALLTQIGQHLRDYTQTTQQGFETLVRLADEHFKAAVERLGASFRKAEIPQQGIEFLEDCVPKLAETACSPQFRKEINSIVVEGHTDSVGTDEYNLRLSQNRSPEVVFESLHALSDLQQNSETMSNLRLCFLDFLSANGRGKVEPIGDQTTEEGRARSRRVVFKIRVRSWEQRQQLREVLGPAAPTTSWSTE